MSNPICIYENKSLELTSIPDNCNTNNNIKKEDFDKEGYNTYCNKTNISNFIGLFDYLYPIRIPLPKIILSYLLLMSEISIIKLEISKCHIDEYEEVYKYLYDKLKEFKFNIDEKYFIRFSRFSPKDGIYKKGPIMTELIDQTHMINNQTYMINIKQIIESLVTSFRINTALKFCKEFNNEECLYINKWRDDWNEMNEFRTFIYNGKITAISQYVWCNKSNYNSETIVSTSNNIIKFIYDNIIDKMATITNDFIVDVIDVNGNIELIEFNPFGKEYSSGSALFHWLNDEDILYGNGDFVYIRYCS